MTYKAWAWHAAVHITQIGIINMLKQNTELQSDSPIQTQMPKLNIRDSGVKWMVDYGPEVVVGPESEGEERKNIWAGIIFPSLHHLSWFEPSGWSWLGWDEKFHVKLKLVSEGEDSYPPHTMYTFLSFPKIMIVKGGNKLVQKRQERESWWIHALLENKTSDGSSHQMVFVSSVEHKVRKRKKKRLKKEKHRNNHLEIMNRETNKWIRWII